MKKLIFGYGETGKAVEQYFINNKIDFEIYDDNISDLIEILLIILWNLMK